MARPIWNGTMSFVLLREVLAKTDKIGIARVVIRTRQYLAALSPRGDALMLDLMRFPQEIVKADEFELPKGNSKSYRVTPPELNMATQLIEAMTKKWNPDDYQDEFRKRLRKIIDEQVARQKGKKVREHKGEEAAPLDATTNVVDFMELLKRSLDKDGKRGGRAAPRKAARKSPRSERRSRSNTRPQSGVVSVTSSCDDLLKRDSDSTRRDCARSRIRPRSRSGCCGIRPASARRDSGRCAAATRRRAGPYRCLSA
jgi:DNA end-binding protein Ku